MQDVAPNAVRIADAIDTICHAYHSSHVSSLVDVITHKKIVNIGVRMTDVPFYLAIANGQIYHFGYNSDKNY